MATSNESAASAQAFVRLFELSMNPLTGEMGFGSRSVEGRVAAGDVQVENRKDGKQGGS